MQLINSLALKCCSIKLGGFLETLKILFSREGIVELVVSKDDGLSTSSGLYTKKFIETGQVSTVSMVSSVIIPKWTKLRLMIRSDIHVYIQEGSTLSLVYIGKHVSLLSIT